LSLGDQFKEFTGMTYAKQAQAVMNAYWDEIEGDAELLWDFTHQFFALDIDKGKEGSDLDEFNAHRFLEKLGETKTVKQMRDELKEIDMDFNKRMALVEYLLWRYKKTVTDFVSRPQGGVDPEELAEAQRLVEEVQRALMQAQAAAEEARQREAEAKAAAEEARERAEEARAAAEEARERAEEARAAAEEAKAREDEAIEKEKPFKIAQEELERALAELHRQEEEYARRCKELEDRSVDPNLGVVQKNKAVNELAQLKSQDPLPLRQAKITTEAAERKADKARAPFKDARERAEVARAEAERTHNEAEKSKREAERTHNEAEKAKRQAEKSAQEAEEARAESDRAVEEVYKALEEAEEKLREITSRPSVPHGQIWWLERELTEAKKFMPKRKQQ